MRTSRRNVIVGGLVMIGMAMKASFAKAQTLLTPPTGQETFGPFYPVRGPRGSELDLTHYPGRDGRALGQVIELGGRVTDRNGKPIAGADILLWQANSAGRYTHPVDTNPAPIDPSFLGVVAFKTDSDGGYTIRTIKPGPYPEPSGTIRTPHTAHRTPHTAHRTPHTAHRTPHIHFDVTHADYRLVTQMYFPGEELNKTDILLSTLSARRRNPDLVICQEAASQESGVRAFRWDIVLLA